MVTIPQTARAFSQTPRQEPRVDDFAPNLDRMFSLHPRERSYLIEAITGTIPPYIRGSYYINGPAIFSRGGFRYRHWLDGDGMVCLLRFTEGPPGFCNRFVRTTKFLAEEESGRPIFRAFGTAFDGDRLKRGMMLESPANVSVYPYSSFLLAFGEQGLPWRLDPETLATTGQFNFHESLNELSPFAAHPKFDPLTGAMFNFGLSYSNKAPRLVFYRFDDSGHLGGRFNLPLDYPCAIHDFSLSPNYLVFYLSPYLMNMGDMARGASVMESLRWRPELGTRLMIVSRQSGEVVAAIEMAGRYCLHLMNTFEQSGTLVLDLVEFDRPIYDQYMTLPDLFTTVPNGRPVRLTVDLKRRALASSDALNYCQSPDFPSIDPRLSGKSNRDFWMLGLSKAGRPGRKFFDQLVHARWDESSPSDIYQSPTGCYLGGEPIFIPEPNSKHGSVICQLFDATHGCSSFVLFNAFQVQSGPVAKLDLQEAIPVGFHASFRPAAL